MSVRNGSQLTGVPWDLHLAGHSSATHTFLVSFLFGSTKNVVQQTKTNDELVFLLFRVTSLGLYVTSSTTEKAK